MVNIDLLDGSLGPWCFVIVQDTLWVEFDI